MEEQRGVPGAGECPPESGQFSLKTKPVTCGDSNSPVWGPGSLQTHLDAREATVGTTDLSREAGVQTAHFLRKWLAQGRFWTSWV